MNRAPVDLEHIIRQIFNPLPTKQCECEIDRRMEDAIENAEQYGGIERFGKAFNEVGKQLHGPVLDDLPTDEHGRS